MVNTKSLPTFYWATVVLTTQLKLQVVLEGLNELIVTKICSTVYNVFVSFKSWYLPYSAACQAKQEHKRARLFPLPVGLSRREFCCLSMPLIICEATRGYQSKSMLNQWTWKMHKKKHFLVTFCVWTLFCFLLLQGFHWGLGTRQIGLQWGQFCLPSVTI